MMTGTVAITDPANRWFQSTLYSPIKPFSATVSGALANEVVSAGVVRPLPETGNGEGRSAIQRAG